MLNKRNDKALNSGDAELNVIRKGVKITGDMHCEKDFRLDGQIDGNLRVDGKLVIGNSGYVQGSIFSANADISGKVQGNIEIKENLILRDSAQIIGDIKTNKINIENGAEFNGTCTMKDNKTEKNIVNTTPDPLSKQNSMLGQP